MGAAVAGFAKNQFSYIAFWAVCRIMEISNYSKEETRKLFRAQCYERIYGQGFYPVQ
jgi:hypothetical protein